MRRLVTAAAGLIAGLTLLASAAGSVPIDRATYDRSSATIHSAGKAAETWQMASEAEAAAVAGFGNLTAAQIDTVGGKRHAWLPLGDLSAQLGTTTPGTDPTLVSYGGGATVDFTVVQGKNVKTVRYITSPVEAADVATALGHAQALPGRGIVRRFQRDGESDHFWGLLIRLD